MYGAVVMGASVAAPVVSGAKRTAEVEGCMDRSPQVCGAFSPFLRRLGVNRRKVVTLRTSTSSQTEPDGGQTPWKDRFLGVFDEGEGLGQSNGYFR
jgi:hypothetical protein